MTVLFKNKLFSILNWESSKKYKNISTNPFDGGIR